MLPAAATRRHRAIAWWVLACSLFTLAFVLTRLPEARVQAASVQAASQAASVHAPVGAATGGAGADAVCAGCHAAIFASYRRTAMARGSGAAVDGLLPGGFTDPTSHIRYRIFRRDGSAWMSYDRPAGEPAGGLSGQQELRYFIGSGHRGRTYLYRQAGLWFELPVNWYTRRSTWAMAPNYEGSPDLPAPLPVDGNCLHCHSTGVAEPEGPARNAMPQPPFLQGGIGCRACHGDPAQHLAAQGHGPIVNPAKLAPDRRDSACIQCHLEGDAVVYKAGRSLAQFQPGDRLSDTAVYFVRASQAAGGSRATSQYEALLQSACKRASGDRLTCTTCHDPHSSPEPAERVAFYRARCLGCHTSPTLAATHHPEQKDCAACHMPSRSTADISHEQVTDHNIQRRPVEASPTKSGTLVPVGTAAAGDRELGLAYAQMAGRGDVNAGRRAMELLQRAERAGAEDAPLSLNLGFLYQVSGQREKAGAEYRRALGSDPHEPAALSNLAVLEASSGHPAEAEALLKTLLEADPSQTAAGMNLALLQCGGGDRTGAAETVRRLASLNPDAPTVRRFLNGGGCAALLTRGAH